MKDIEKKLEQINFELRERVKELTVAYEICHSLSKVLRHLIVFSTMYSRVSQRECSMKMLL
jgi:hypothetical protein